jgi:hypothetical protein
VATRWSTAEDQQLRQLYAHQLPVEQIAGRLARSPDAVVARRQALGIAPRRRSRPWSPREQALLRAAAASGQPASLVTQRLGRSTEQIRARRRTLVAPPPPARPYLAHEDEAICVCLAERGDLGALGRGLGRSPHAVRLHAQQLGIYRARPAEIGCDQYEDDPIERHPIGHGVIARAQEADYPSTSGARPHQRGNGVVDARVCGARRHDLGRCARGRTPDRRPHVRDRGRRRARSGISKAGHLSPPSLQRK